MKFLPLGLLAALVCLAVSFDAHAQGCGPSNPNCIVTTMPLGDASKRAASDEFVQNAIAAIPPTTPPAGTNGQLQYNNSGAFGGFTPGQDATINPATGAVNVTKLQNVPATATGASTNDIFYYSGSGWLHNTLVAVVNAVCNLSPSTCVGIFGYVYPAWYGALCDGSTNDIAAFTSAVTAATGKSLFIPPATCVINAHLNLPSGISVVGAGRDVSVLKQTGQDYFFGLSNVSNVSVRDVAFLGTRSYTSWGSSPIGAISISANTSQSNLAFKNLKISAVNGSYWIEGQQSAAIISNVTFDNVWIISVVADIPTDANPINNTNYAWALFSGTAGSRWENVSIVNSQVDGAGLCFGASLFSNHYKYNVSNNRFLSLGGVNTAGHCTNGLGATNAYGVLVYDLNSDGNPASDGTVCGNYFLNPIASAIYYAGDGISFARGNNSAKALVCNNSIDGQTHSDVLLPRGAIALNLSTDIAAVGNLLSQNAIGINVASQNAGDVSVLANHCWSNAGGSVCLQQTSGSNGSSNTDRRVVRANLFDGLATAVNFTSATGARFNDVDLSGNTLYGGTAAIAAASQFFNGMTVVSGNNIRSGSVSFGSLTGNLTLYGNPGMSFTAATLPAAANGSSVFVSDGAPASACTGASTGSTGFRQNGAWKCF